MMRMVTLTFPLLALAPVPSRAAMLSAEDLVTACSGDPVGQATCNGYLMAVTDFALQRESRGHAGKVCVPETVTIGQVRDAVLNVAHGAGPEGGQAEGGRRHGGGQGLLRGADGLRLVSRALRITWPCDAPPKQQ